MALDKSNQASNFEVKGQGHRESKCENRFLLKASPKVDRFTSNQDQNIVQYISPADMLQKSLVIFSVCLSVCHVRFLQAIFECVESLYC